jgi:hypothetical protein
MTSATLILLAGARRASKLWMMGADDYSAIFALFDHGIQSPLYHKTSRSLLQPARSDGVDAPCSPAFKCHTVVVVKRSTLERKRPNANYHDRIRPCEKRVSNSWHRLLIRQQTMLINAIRGHMAELG